MSFNNDLSKQAQEVIDHPAVIFNNSLVARTPCQKHLCLFLDEKLNFSCHVNEKICKYWRNKKASLCSS